ncbi:MAG: efflux RND transporter permease subunit, partial [Pleurocapsa sp.]
MSKLETPEQYNTQPDLNGNGQKKSDRQQKPSPVSRFFFLNTIFAILLTKLLVVGGILGYMGMVKQSDPDIEIAVATVTTTWGGADPETIEQQVTSEIETEISSVENVKEIRSASYTGFSVIRVEFTSNADVSRSIQELRDAVSQAEAEIPEDADKPIVEQVSIDDAPIITLALFGELDPVVISHAAENIEDRLEQVAGVSEVDLGGAREEVISVQMNPARLATLGISPTTVAQQIRNANTDVPLNEIESDIIGPRIRFYGRFRTIEDLEQLPI